MMLSEENKLNNIGCPDDEINENVQLLNEDHSCITSCVGYDNIITQDKTYILNVGIKSIKYVVDELQLKTIEIISDLINLGVPVRCLDDILLEGVKKYYRIMCKDRSQNYLIKNFKESKGA